LQLFWLARMLSLWGQINHRGKLIQASMAMRCRED